MRLDLTTLTRRFLFHLSLYFIFYQYQWPWCCESRPGKATKPWTWVPPLHVQQVIIKWCLVGWMMTIYRKLHLSYGILSESKLCMNMLYSFFFIILLFDLIWFFFSCGLSRKMLCELCIYGSVSHGLEYWRSQTLFYSKNFCSLVK